jgi:hypothetical protein
MDDSYKLALNISTHEMIEEERLKIVNSKIQEKYDSDLLYFY